MTPREYIEDNFRQEDRLALVSKAGDIIAHRIATVAEILTPRFQKWMYAQNAYGGNIYISMNALLSDATRRTKANIGAIRHIYLDIDNDGIQTLARIKSDEHLPEPSYVLTTSPGKYQIIWKASGFTMEDAERLQKAMAIQYGADRAATDVSRILRLPDFLNHKYDPPCMVTAEKISGRICHPTNFDIERNLAAQPVSRLAALQEKYSNSRSEWDWAMACIHLERGDSPAEVRDWLEHSRPDKPNPQYYAELTVSKALLKTHCRKALSTDFKPAM